MSRIQFTAVIWEEEGVYISKCPEVEVSSTGDSPQEALANLKEAIELWIVNSKKLEILDDFKPALTATQKFMSIIETEL